MMTVCLVMHFMRIASQCKHMGIQLNFAPDIDINNNPQNPVINTRSFSDDKFEVAEGGILYMQALQNQHVLACGKHFPAMAIQIQIHIMPYL